jgi:transcription elongation GreA/GreB family factor
MRLKSVYWTSGDSPDNNLIEVQLGDEIEIKYENGPFSGNVSRYFLTNSSSAVARGGYAPLSMETPLARVLLGCVEGSNAHFLVNNLKVDVQILHVARAE